MKRVICLVAVLVLASAAIASPIYVNEIKTYEVAGEYGGRLYITIDRVASNLETYGGEFVDVYDVYFDVLGTNQLGGFDAAVTGALYQVACRVTKTVTQRTPDLEHSNLDWLYHPEYDSRFNLQGEAWVAKTLPVENNPADILGEDTDREGYGTYLAARVGIDVGSQSHDLKLLTIVVAHGATATFSAGNYNNREGVSTYFAGLVAVGSSAGESFNVAGTDIWGQDILIDSSPIIPEPATLGLLLLGGVGLIARKRRG